MHFESHRIHVNQLESRNMKNTRHKMVCCGHMRHKRERNG